MNMRVKAEDLKPGMLVKINSHPQKMECAVPHTNNGYMLTRLVVVVEPSSKRSLGTRLQVLWPQFLHKLNNWFPTVFAACRNRRCYWAYTGWCYGTVIQTDHGTINFLTSHHPSEFEVVSE